MQRPGEGPASEDAPTLPPPDAGPSTERTLPLSSGREPTTVRYRQDLGTPVDDAETPEDELPPTLPPKGKSRLPRALVMSQAEQLERWVAGVLAEWAELGPRRWRKTLSCEEVAAELERARCDRNRS